MLELKGIQSTPFPAIASDSIDRVLSMGQIELFDF